MDWSNGGPTCSGWSNSFGTSYPIIDGSADDDSLWYLLALNNIVPRHVVIDHNMEIIYSSNNSPSIQFINDALLNVPMDLDNDSINDPVDNCPTVYNPSQDDIDDDGLGNACDLCHNSSIWVLGNLDGSQDHSGVPIIDVMDVLILVDMLLTGESGDCAYETANIHVDTHVNVLDVVTLVQIILNGNIDHSVAGRGSGMFMIHHEDDGDLLTITSSELISGFQFDVVKGDAISESLDKSVLPPGWLLDYETKTDVITVLAFDASGINPKETINLYLDDISIQSFDNVVVGSATAAEILLQYSESKNLSEILITDNPEITRLYPNPFNPVLSVDFSLPFDTPVYVSVYNALGKEVSVLLKNSTLKAGNYTMSWDAEKQQTGIYFIQIKTPDQMETKKALLVK